MRHGLKSAVLVLALIGFTVGITACAKYPVVSDTRASSPSAAAPAPTR
jgi:hypothetical protein